MHHELLRTIDPRFRLADVFERWWEIIDDLSEPNRKRRPQTERLARLP